MKQSSLFDDPVRPSDYTGHSFGGATFDQERDGERLSKQLSAVRDYCLKRDWVFLATMAKDLNYPPTSIPALSARLRDLRKPQFGGYMVEREYVDGGLWKYRVRQGKIHDNQ